jgi:hypothetical protein
MAPPTEARIVAKTPLLRAGLQRIVAEAGLNCTNTESPEALTFREPDCLPTHAFVEISQGSDHVQVVIRRQPDPMTWTAVMRVVAIMIDEVSRTRAVKKPS